VSFYRSNLESPLRLGARRTHRRDEGDRFHERERIRPDVPLVNVAAAVSDEMFHRVLVRSESD
jgi:hypothetical protein